MMQTFLTISDDETEKSEKGVTAKTSSGWFAWFAASNS